MRWELGIENQQIQNDQSHSITSRLCFAKMSRQSAAKSHPKDFESWAKAGVNAKECPRRIQTDTDVMMSNHLYVYICIYINNYIYIYIYLYIVQWNCALLAKCASSQIINGHLPAPTR